jgi:seryl-tRNA synthetase
MSDTEAERLFDEIQSGEFEDDNDYNLLEKLIRCDEVIIRLETERDQLRAEKAELLAALAMAIHEGIHSPAITALAKHEAKS